MWETSEVNCTIRYCGQCLSGCVSYSACKTISSMFSRTIPSSNIFTQTPWFHLEHVLKVLLPQLSSVLRPQAKLRAHASLSDNTAPSIQSMARTPHWLFPPPLIHAFAFNMAYDRALARGYKNKNVNGITIKTSRNKCQTGPLNYVVNAGLARRSAPENPRTAASILLEMAPAPARCTVLRWPLRNSRMRRMGSIAHLHDGEKWVSKSGD